MLSHKDKFGKLRIETQAIYGSGSPQPFFAMTRHPKQHCANDQGKPILYEQLWVANISKSAWWTFGVSTAILMANKRRRMAVSLGERIYKLRTEKGMSQGDLSDALEVSRQSISKWETNGSVPELDKLVKLSEIFGVSLDELVVSGVVMAI